MKKVGIIRFADDPFTLLALARSGLLAALLVRAGAERKGRRRKGDDGSDLGDGGHGSGSPPFFAGCFQEHITPIRACAKEKAGPHDAARLLESAGSPRRNPPFTLLALHAGGGSGGLLVGAGTEGEGSCREGNDRSDLGDGHDEFASFLCWLLCRRTINPMSRGKRKNPVFFNSPSLARGQIHLSGVDLDGRTFLDMLEEVRHFGIPQADATVAGWSSNQILAVCSVEVDVTASGIGILRIESLQP